ncbi:acyl--CoA ligase [Sinimarinibacterium sp. CAU 1509]|uniref:class I adenylate-forming enzyme family protein n=1 Tax=Sinimarinibacterium sp. CAU 1509 TaxID=2562283 RepID=UPI0010ACD206|nr:class I adenylate-forming enzyme family protein [Sinimarinibacterium sp. CAU 1509]TJY58937.1 acyl--CoA ligase [Sinimarinibacterium sp. CAU 1509]
MNISTILDMAAEAFGDRIGVVCGDERMSYTELRETAYAAAQRIKASGAQYLVLLDVNSPAATVAVFAAAYADVPYVPLNYRLTPTEINELIERASPAYLITSAELRAKIQPRDDMTVVDRSEVLAEQAPEDAPPPEVGDDPRAVAVQLFTSGTTGKPKAAILRHENLMSYIVGTVEFAAADEDDAILVTVPPYHIAGISSVLSSTYACRRVVQMPNFDAAEWLRLCAQERVSNAFLVPTMLQRIVEHLDASGTKPELPALRALAYGGGKMPQTTIARAMQLFPNVDFTNAYGLTETSSTVAVLGPDDHREAAASSDPYVQKRLGSVGRATGAVEIQIRDDDDRPVGVDVPGYVFVRGPQVSGEYKQQGSQLDSEGWFPTRDRGWLDRDGYLYLEGRADDVIVRGGENISPGEIEDVLLTHPAVADVACVAMPDEQWGEAVAAAVVLKDGASASVEELQTLVRGKLRSSRVPQAIVFKDALPYSETGKLLRRVVRQEFAAT